MSKNDYLLTGTGTAYDIWGLLVLAGVYGVVGLYNLFKLYLAFACQDYRKLHRLQGLLMGSLFTVILRLLWVLVCLLTWKDLAAVMLGVAPNVVMNALGSAFCYFWWEMCIKSGVKDEKKAFYTNCNVAAICGFNSISAAGLFLAAVDWNHRSEWSQWECPPLRDIYAANLFLSLLISIALFLSGRTAYRCVLTTLQNTAGQAAANRLKSIAVWCTAGYALKGVLPTLVFLKEVGTGHPENAPQVKVSFLVLLYCVTELLPLSILICQLQVSSKRLASSPAVSDASPSINSLESLSHHSGRASLQLDISASFLLE